MGGRSLDCSRVDGSAEDSGGSLADRLRVVPQKFSEYLAETSRNCVAQALGLVKSYWPSAKIAVLGDGMCSTCDHGTCPIRRSSTAVVGQLSSQGRENLLGR